MKLNNKIKFQPTLILGILLAIIFAYEAYLLYSKVYLNLTTNVDYVATGNIVRLDLDSYYKTIDLLDQNRIYVSPARDLFHPNPFQ